MGERAFSMDWTTRTLFLLGFTAMTLGAQDPTVTRIEFQVDPGTKIRPLEPAVLLVKVYGELTDAQGKREGRIRQAGWNISVSPNDGGWLGKAFKYQGTDKEAFLESTAGRFASIFRGVTNQFTLKDAVVYHAPATPGKYRVEASIGSVRGQVEIEVAADAPSQYKDETVHFGRERRPNDSYRLLAERYAPYIAQETWFDWKADALCRSDYDGDWNLGNNWDNLGTGSTQAFVYYAAIESKTHWFLIYNFFHARDYSDNCVVGMCHENDNEGMILTVRKDGTEFGLLEAMETLAHNNVYSYVNDSSIRGGVHNIESKIYFHDGTHPVVFIEAGGHGALGGGDKKSFFAADRMSWTQGTGITYVYKGSAERPKHGMDKDVGYELLPIFHHWWPRAQPGAGDRAFSNYYSYQPLGDRPRMKTATIGGSFLGIKHGADKAKPFWGWHDENTKRKKVLGTGQWGADPAYAVSRNLTFPASKPVSLEYVFNPYLTGELPADTADTTLVTKTVEGTATAPTPVAEAAEGICEFELTVDGAAALTFEAGQPKWQTLEGAPLEERKSACPGLPAAGNFAYSIAKQSGRGQIRMIDNTTGRIEIRDGSRGAAAYTLQVRWKRQ